MPTTLDRHRGALLGLATGDALGTTLEFRPPGTFEPITDMPGGGPFNVEPGQWTDDTSMALCLAESLIECNGFDAFDQMRRYLRWYRSGYLSSRGECFDIGNTVRAALEKFESAREDAGESREAVAWQGSTNPRTAGNGSLMRLAPIPLFFSPHADPPPVYRGSSIRPPRPSLDTLKTIAHHAALSSKTTHAAPEAVDACRLYAVLIALALNGTTKSELLDFEGVADVFAADPLSPRIHEVAAGSYRKKVAPRGVARREDEIRGTGYVVDSLEAALWSFDTTGNFRDGALAAANLGDDADTTAAIYGQLAGAFYGVESIPTEWIEKLTMREEIENLATRLHAKG